MWPASGLALRGLALITCMSCTAISPSCTTRSTSGSTRSIFSASSMASMVIGKSGITSGVRSSCILPVCPNPRRPLVAVVPASPVFVTEVDDLPPERLVVPPLVLANVDDEPLRGSLLHYILRATHVPTSTAANRTLDASTYPTAPGTLPDLHESMRFELAGRERCVRPDEPGREEMAALLEGDERPADERRDEQPNYDS